METTQPSDSKNLEFTLWTIGFFLLLIASASEIRMFNKEFLSKTAYALLLIPSVLFMGVSLALKIKRESKKAKFSIVHHAADIFRYVGGLFLAGYFLAQALK